MQVYACEWNPASLDAFRRNLELNGITSTPACLTGPTGTATAGSGLAKVQDEHPTTADGGGGGSFAPPVSPPPLQPLQPRVCIRAGDCRVTAPVDCADRVLLGLLPSSEGGWRTALGALRNTTGRAGAGGGRGGAGGDGAGQGLGWTVGAGAGGRV